MQQINESYDEISLREIIEVLLKGWRLIAIITAICLVLSGIFSFFIQEPTYEAKTIMMASFATNNANSSGIKNILMTSLGTDKSTILENDTEDISNILDSIATYPIMTIQTYEEQIISPQLLQQVIDELGLDKHDINRNSLTEMIEVENIKGTNLIAIKVTHNDPKLAADIANVISQKSTAFVTEITKQQASKSSQYLKEQMEVEKKNLDEATLELKELLSQPRGVNELSEEFNSKLLMLTNYKTQIVEKEVELNKVKSGLTAAEQELKITPKIFITKKSVGDDPLLNQILAETKGTSVKNTAQVTMESEEMNEGYISLRTKVSDYKIAVSELSRELDMVKTKIETTQKELEGIQLELADKEYNQGLIQRKADLSQGIYDAFLNKYEETRIAESTEVGDPTINIISQAFVPERPTGPRKMLNLAIAGVLGIMIGVFIIFFKYYWQISGKQLEISK